MKVVLIISDFGAFNNFLAELSEKLSQDPSYTLHIICSRNKVIEIDDKELFFERPNIKFHFIDIPRNVNLFGELRAARKIRAFIQAIKPDIIHSHFTTATFPTILFRTNKYLYWSTIHGLGMNSSKGFTKLVFTIAETICFLRVDRIFVVNNEDYNLVKKFFSKKLTKYRCLGFGCDIDKFNPANFSEYKKTKLRNKLGIGDGVIVITFTGRYVHFKGFNLIIKSFKQLCHECPDKFKLILMGGLDPVHKTGLDRSAESFFCSSKDIINIGFTNDVDLYLSITDIFLFPSKKEGLPTCLLESLAMGIPVITFDARGNNEIVKDNYNGILIQPDTEANEIEKITDALMQLALNKDKRSAFKSNAMRDRSKYSRNSFINEHVAYYSQINKEQPVEYNYKIT